MEQLICVLALSSRLFANSDTKAYSYNHSKHAYNAPSIFLILLGTMDTIATAVTKKSQAISGESQLRQFGQFLDAHDRLLGQLGTADARGNLYRASGQPTAVQCAPVRLHLDRREQLTHHQLASTNNTVLNKIVCVFAELCTEAQRLRQLAERQQLRFLFVDERLLADGGDASVEQPHQQQLVVRISEQLEFLCEIQYLVQRCIVVGAEMLRQLGAFFGSSTAFVTQTTSTAAVLPAIQLQIVFHRLADIATTFVRFDHILQRSNLHEHWPHFLAAIDTLHDHHQHDQLPSGLPVYADAELSGLQSVLHDMQQLLFGGDLFATFQTALQQVRNTGLDPGAAAVVAQHWAAFVRVQLQRIETAAPLAAPSQQPLLLNDFAEARDAVKLNVMAVLLHGVFGRLEPPMAARLFDLNGRLCGVTLLEHFAWLPEEFFGRHVVYAPRSAGAKLLAKYRSEAVRTRHEALRTRFAEPRVAAAAQTLCARVLLWQLQVREAAARPSATADLSGPVLTARAALLLDGVRMLGELGFLVKVCTQRHIELGTVMQRATLATVCRLLEHCQCVRSTFAEHAVFVVAAVQAVGQHVAYQALAVVQQTMQRLQPTASERDIDRLSALQLAERALFGPATAQRVLVARLALSVADPTAVFGAAELEVLSDRLGRLEGLLELRGVLARRGDTTFVYWHQTILAGYVRQVQQQQTGGDGDKMMTPFHSPPNSVQFLARIDARSADTDAGADACAVDIDQLFRGHYLARICSHIENNLRLFIHTYMHDTPAPSSANASAASALTAAYHKHDALQSAGQLALAAVRPLPLRDHHFVFRNHIEHYLSRTFYNLTAVSLSDGRTYDEMRSFARIKYGLRIVADQLPSETIEQGLDVLDVMRHMDDFVSRFVYDMNGQVFVQTTSANNFLNTVTVAHVVNSLRTHGIGIVNTAINCGYKLLCQKMPLVSKFLYTDKVKSALAKCVRHFSEHKERANERFSFDLARMFVKNAPRLTAADQSFGDFLATVTQIGNIMGYVRLVRSAGIRCVSRAGVFLPARGRREFPLAERSVELQLSAETCEAAWNVKVNITNLSKDFVHKPDYFKSFLQAFNDIIRDPKNAHLKHFYICLPALTVLFVDGLVRSKEYKHMKSAAEAPERLVFTDDGFAMGVAYVLVVLGQVEAFWTLDWFAAVAGKYAQELAELEAKRTALTGSFADEKLRQTLLLSSRRIGTFAEEFELLRCNLRCALRFFQ